MDILDLYSKHGDKVITDNNNVETSPKRKRIRDEVHENMKKSAEKMSEQYNRKKRIKVRELVVDDKVMVTIQNRIDRKRTQRESLPRSSKL